MQQSDPFPHTVWDGLWHPQLITDAHAEMLQLWAEQPGAWQRYSNSHEGKLAMTFARSYQIVEQLPRTSVSLGACAAIGAVLASEPWIARLERETGLEGLTFDDLGGGLHLIPPGGFLDVHVDFNRHDDGRYRRVNCLLYLCETGEGGALELWRDATSGPTVIIDPAPNRTVAFLTGEHSWHGHPHPLQGDAARCSLASYYYTSTPPEECAAPHSTIFLED